MKGSEFELTISLSLIRSHRLLPRGRWKDVSLAGLLHSTYQRSRLDVLMLDLAGHARCDACGQC